MLRFAECFYADNTQLVGGVGSVINPNPLPVTSTGECIDACVKTWGCRYWTVTKTNANVNSNANAKLTSDTDVNTEINVNCDLQKWKGRRIEAEGYISGSLPSACCKSKITDASVA